MTKRHAEDAKLWAKFDDDATSPIEKESIMRVIFKREMERDGSGGGKSFKSETFDGPALREKDQEIVFVSACSDDATGGVSIFRINKSSYDGTLTLLSNEWGIEKNGQVLEYGGTPIDSEARQLTAERSNTVGIILEDVENPNNICTKCTICFNSLIMTCSKCGGYSCARDGFEWQCPHCGHTAKRMRPVSKRKIVRATTETASIKIAKAG